MLNLKPRIKHPISHFIKHFNSWALAIKNAHSPNEALHFYSQMHRQSPSFDSFSILFTLKSCTHLRNLNVIHHLHSHVLKLGFISHVYVATSLLHAYVVTSFGLGCKLFDEMPEKNVVTWNTMITGYSKSGNVDKARGVFDLMPLRAVSSWSAMIAAYMNDGDYDRGLALFREMMRNEGLKPDQVTVGSVLSGCAHLGSVGLLIGKSVHVVTVKNGWELNVDIGTILVDMYAKCGFLNYAIMVFELMKERNVMAWTALICGSAQHGFGKEALCLFEMMQKNGVRPNEMTFTGILSACAHTGLVEDGRKHFKIIEEYGLEPRIQHYGCMVDLFGKAGLLEEAYEVIRTMRFEPNVVIWGSFLAACKEHKKFDMAERVIEQVLRMVKPENDGGVFTLICDLYVLNEKWDDAERVRKLMLNKNVRKARGSSFTKVGL
ncbi:pentatricopeptide repeat-containing protein At5g66520-like [Pistacia vera]|uniref:pentatricopeptide repeat-containing protein At5g66520-like n=1 Tax=Pistacia vera TaxID=55513 RepID=UPI0012638329|nr:pentatricopeptide repeat-containing protein At5g66520-like [Pistacia vera]